MLAKGRPAPDGCGPTYARDDRPFARTAAPAAAIDAVDRINALFAIERDINGKPPPERCAFATNKAGHSS